MQQFMLAVKLKRRASYFKICWKLFFVLNLRIWVKKDNTISLRMKTDAIDCRCVCRACSPCWSLAGWPLVISCARLMKKGAIVRSLAKAAYRLPADDLWLEFLLDCRLESACRPGNWCSVGIIGVCFLRWWWSACCCSTVFLFLYWVSRGAPFMLSRENVACLV